MSLAPNLMPDKISNLMPRLIGKSQAPFRSNIEFHVATFQEGVSKINLVAVDGLDNAGTWKGQDGAPHNGTQAVTSQKPKYIVDGINGRPALLFTAADKQFFKLDTFTKNLTATDTTCFVVAQFNFDGNLRPLLSQFLAPTLGNIFVKDTDDKINLATVLPAENPVSGSPQIYGFKFTDAVTPTIKGTVYQNNNQEATGPAPSSFFDSNGAWQIGVDSVALPASAHMDGLIGEILIYNRALSDGERIKVLAYLMAKWRIVF